ncbi:MAG: hypothetical protein IPK44_13050 [Candidatus Accumulibacter sp.]|uniref:hypothetical protein n=1 Tax=Accumulibacter sp. TaxID=2053492 RepID=UPI0025840F1C|nr:hypothetical protein [Accumulibacter sp.]MBK8115382.1 hypothetical protein [Accumulibacter sp.]
MGARAEAGRRRRKRRATPVTLQHPAVGRHEVTRGQYAAFVKDSGYRGEASVLAIWIGPEYQSAGRIRVTPTSARPTSIPQSASAG